ncbi:DUF2066 domain-containing protein [Methylophaga sp.]|uniref:DUF2066 domain-containing protein n=1 Tax=Methylophaga sp. TaxID=2024840 RepID=UPI003F69734C
MHRLFFTLILLSLTCGSHAAEVDNLYQAELPINSRDKQERAELTPQLLQQVILKVVGDSARVSDTDLSPMLDNADKYVQQFEYQRSNIVEADLTQPDQLTLRLSFDPDGVNQAIRNLGLPVWGRIRPDILTWIAIKQNSKQTLLGSDNVSSNAVEYLDNAARKRGLPLLLPLMDLEDQFKVNFDTVWQQDASSIQSASMRYGADIILMSQVMLNDATAKIEWAAIISGDVKKWQSQGTLQEAFELGMGELADMLSSRFSQTLNESQPNQILSVQVSDVLDYGDFTRLMRYLRQLDYITDIEVINLNDQKLDLAVAFDGSLDVLERTLAVGRMLAEETRFDGNDAKQYRLLP